MRFPTLLAVLLLPLILGTASSPVRGTLTLHLAADPDTLNAVSPSDAYARAIHAWVFDPLLRKDPETWEWVPALAETYSISPDGRRFTFRLREGVRWHDGKPFTSEDVRYSFDICKSDRFPVSAEKTLYHGVESVEAPDARTVVVRMKHRRGVDFDLIARKLIVPRHFYSEGDAKHPRFTRELVGTGPYRLAEWERTQRVLLKRNDAYWGDNLPFYRERNRLESVTLRIVTDPTASLELVKAGQIDFMGLSPEQFRTLEKDQGAASRLVAVQARNEGPTTYSFIAWNPKHPWLKEASTRMAMSLLLNRELMASKLGYGMIEPVRGPFGIQGPAYPPSLKAVSFDPKRALELLKREGWKMGTEGLERERGGKKEKFEISVLCSSALGERLLTFARENMAAVGINLKVRVTEFGNMLTLIGEANYDGVMFSLGAHPREPEVRSVWHSESKSFVTGYANPTLDRLIEAAEVELDAGRRLKKFHPISEWFATQQPMSFLFGPKYVLYAHSKRVRKKKDSFRYDLGIDTWTIAQKEDATRSQL